MLALCLLLYLPAAASDADDLERLLQEFLANAHRGAAHERFWAEDLVYSSSAGKRFGKAEILQGFESAVDDGSAPDTVYRGEAVDVRVYGDTAVVAFRLVGTPSDGEGEVQQYYNTGTFVKRDGTWRAVAWQATKIPAAERVGGD